MARSMSLCSLGSDYRTGASTPTEVVERVFDRIEERGKDHVWTTVSNRELVLRQAAALEGRRDALEKLPLFGLPFGVKDNIDVAGVPTTCGCAGFDRRPTSSAYAVQRAINAGALFIGKQALDQFATGLNGTRAIGGHCFNVFDPDYRAWRFEFWLGRSRCCRAGEAFRWDLIPEAQGVCAGDDNIVGLRPSMGLVSSRGMVYNNPQFDCIPIFANGVDDAFQVLSVIAGFDPLDFNSRVDADRISLDVAPAKQFRFAIPDRLEWFATYSRLSASRKLYSDSRTWVASPARLTFRLSSRLARSSLTVPLLPSELLATGRC